MPESTFKETIITRVMFVGFFILMGAAIVVALFLKVSDGLIWLLPALLVAALVGSMIYYLWSSYQNQQKITITPKGISVVSRQRSKVEILWSEVEDVHEVQSKSDELRETVPGIEVLLTYYIMLPSTSTGQRRGLLVLKARDGRKIAIRQHMLYDYRLEQLLQAIDIYAPLPDPASDALRTNTQN